MQRAPQKLLPLQTLARIYNKWRASKIPWNHKILKKSFKNCQSLVLLSIFSSVTQLNVISDRQKQFTLNWSESCSILFFPNPAWQLWDFPQEQIGKGISRFHCEVMHLSLLLTLLTLFPSYSFAQQVEIKKHENYQKTFEYSFPKNFQFSFSAEEAAASRLVED